MLLLGQYVIAQLDALIADVDLGAGYNLVNLIVTAPAERAARIAFGGPTTQNGLLYRGRGDLDARWSDDLVDDAVFNGCRGRHKKVALSVEFNAL